jgi:hypothetical protein
VSTTRLGVLAVVALFGAIGCSSSADTGFGGPPPSDDGGSGSSSSGSSGGGASSGSSSSGGASSGGGSGSIGTPPPDASAPEAGSPDTGTGGAGDAGVDTGGMTTTDSDGFGASRTACINKINALRATNTAVALQPYTLQDTDTLDMCVDTQATNDQAKGIAHDSFMNNTPGCMWGNAMGFAQNECEQGYGTSPSGIEQCIQDMWDESLKPNCMGCVGCTQFGGNCPNCDYSGSMGYECGHYVNLSAPYFTMVACGFAGSAPSSQDSWSVQNFE